MSVHKLSPFHYYEYDDYIFLAKRGTYDSTSDVFKYDSKENRWLRFNISDKKWSDYTPMIFQSREMSLEDLKGANIPLLEDNSPDLTTQMLEEAEKLKGKIKNNPQ